MYATYINLTSTHRAGACISQLRNIALNVSFVDTMLLFSHLTTEVVPTICKGYLPPTSGTAVIDGHDITTDRQGANSTIGFCPQNNTLFRDLTVEEHLMLFAKVCFN